MIHFVPAHCRFLVWICTSCILCGSPRAQEREAASDSQELKEEDLLFAPDELGGDFEQFNLADLLGTVQSVSGRSESLLTAPASVSILTRQDIRLSGARSLPDMLRRVPGVQVVYNAPGNYIVSLRGMGGLQDNNVLVLLDGFPVNNRVNGAVNWAILPVHPDEIEQIEIVRGPVSTIYGANAYTGAIQIITHRDMEFSSLSASLESGLDSRASQAADGQVHARGRSGDWLWKIGLQGRWDQGNTYLPQPAGREPKGLSSVGGNLSAHYDLGPKKKFSFWMAGALGDRAGLSSLVITPVQTRQSWAGFQAKVEAGELELGWLENAAIWIRGQQTRAYRADAGDDESAREFSLAGTDALYGQAGLNATLELPLRIRMGLGVEAALENVQAPYLHPDSSGVTRPEYGGRLSLDWNFHENWSLSAAGRLDASALSGVRESYRLSVGYTDNEATSVRMTLASGFRRPTYIEKTGRFVNPDLGIVVLEGSSHLEPQRITSIELGSFLVPIQGMIIAPTLYVMHLENVISENFEPLIRKTYENLKTPSAFVHLLGAELDFQYEWLDGLNPRLSFSYLYWPNDLDSEKATVGLADYNSAIIAELGATGEFVSGRLGYGLSVGLTTPRSYRIRTGVPPLLFESEVATRARVEVAADYQLIEHWPLWIWLRTQISLPHEQTESPYPAAARPGTVFLIGVAIRDW